MKNDCPFCNSEVLSQSFGDEGEFLALYNHAPIVEGHCLVIPRKHVSHLLEMDDEEYKRFMLFARKVATFMTGYFNTDEFDMTIQQGANAGQSVEHLHVHIIPRKKGDLPEGVEWYDEMQHKSIDTDKKLPQEELSRIAKELRAAFQQKLK
jgi:bis(5'-adenosyl)-triphosphatase